MQFLYLLEKIRNPLLDAIFSVITLLGDETFFIAAAIVVFWCIEKKLGYFMMSVCFFGTVLNQFLKIVFRIPRPWATDPSFTVVGSAVEAAKGYSFPSGHTQNAFGIFATYGVYSRNKRVCTVCFVIASLIGFSRLYLGVHFPTDVIVSAALALVLIFIFLRFFSGEGDASRVIFPIICVMAACALGFVLFSEFYAFPADTDAEELFLTTKHAYYLFGGVLGIVVAYPIEKKYIGFETKASLPVQIIKAAVGFALVLAIKSALKKPLIALLPYENLAHMIRYFAVVFFAVAVWPISFKYLDRIGKKSDDSPKC